VDESYHTYLNRVAKLTLTATYESQVKNIQESPKFSLTEDGSRQPIDFPGYSVITPPRQEDPNNKAFYAALVACQQELSKHLESDLIVNVDPDSFHFTLADLIWDSAFKIAVENDPKFEEKLRDRVADSFELYAQSLPKDKPIRWQIMGLTIRPRAIEVSLVPKDEESYQRVLAFRRAIYQSSSLIALGIEQQYYFTAHVTIAYFGNVDREIDRANLIDTLQNYNMHWIDHPQEIIVSEAQLRKFTNMSNYRREADWPTVSL
jgi:hypothetical protein